ncbi:hypothetical protein CMK11_09445 [Candidatus Poribacteria bacterium]|nr:hypothetical protein [Candidatus Poribacteria bacterium]
MIRSLASTCRRALREPGAWVVGASAILYACVLVPHWRPTWDSATYIALARSLVAGDGYTYMGYDHTKYPPGFPLLLAPIVGVFGPNFLLMRGLVAGCAVASVAAAYALIRRAAGPWVAAAAAAMTAASYALLFESTRILSDVPYMLVSLLALLAAERLREARSWRRLAGVAALCVAAYLVRIVGFTVAVAVAISLVADAPRIPLRKAARDAAVVLVALAAVAAVWMGRNALVTNELPPTLREALSYEAELVATDPSHPHTGTLSWPALRARLATNARYYATLTALLLTSKRSPAWWLALVVIAGWALTGIRGATAAEWYFAGYVAVYILWPAHQGERFLVPVLPFIFYYALAALTAIGALVARVATAPTSRRPLAESATAAVLAAAFVLAGAREVGVRVRTERRDPYYQGVMRDYIAALAWLREASAPDAVIVTNRAPYGVLWAERPTYTVPWVADHAEILASIRANGATHAVTNSYTQRYLGPVVDANPGVFRPIAEIGSTRVYEIVRAGP